MVSEKRKKFLEKIGEAYRGSHGNLTALVVAAEDLGLGLPYVRAWATQKRSNRSVVLQGVRFIRDSRIHELAETRVPRVQKRPKGWLALKAVKAPRTFKKRHFEALEPVSYRGHFYVSKELAVWLEWEHKKRLPLPGWTNIPGLALELGRPNATAIHRWLRSHGYEVRSYYDASSCTMAGFVRDEHAELYRAGAAARAKASSHRYGPHFTTKMVLYRRLCRSGPLSCEALSRQLDITAASTRSGLRALVAAGLVERVSVTSRVRFHYRALRR